jgi:antitoxin component YwqK of YwqJK toxin-antitoxin module
MDEPTPTVLLDDCDYSDAQELLYKGVPFTGTVVERSADGRIISLQSFRHGIQDGLSRVWDTTGTLRLETDYAFGMRRFRREWHANGQIKRDIDYGYLAPSGVAHDLAWDETGNPVDPC